MKKYQFKIILFFCGLLISKNTDIEFNYGFLKALSGDYDNVVVLEDSTLIYTKDRLRINIGTNGYYFYVIYVDSQNKYYNLYSENLPFSHKQQFIEPLKWQGLDNNTGWETFYFINSIEEQAALNRYFTYYNRSRGDVRQGLGDKIQDILNELYSAQENVDIISSTLKDPILGGVTMRGDEDSTLTQYHLTHYCKGENGVAIKKITLNHKNRK